MNYYNQSVVRPTDLLDWSMINSVDLFDWLICYLLLNQLFDCFIDESPNRSMIDHLLIYLLISQLNDYLIHWLTVLSVIWLLIDYSIN